MKAKHASLQLQSNWEREKSQQLCAIVFDEKKPGKSSSPIQERSASRQGTAFGQQDMQSVLCQSLRKSRALGRRESLRR